MRKIVFFIFLAALLYPLSAVEICPISKIPTKIEIVHERDSVAKAINVTITLIAIDPTTQKEIPIPGKNITWQVVIVTALQAGKDVTDKKGVIALSFKTPIAAGKHLDPDLVNYNFTASFDGDKVFMGSFNSIAYKPIYRGAVSPAMCLPLFIILGILMAAMYAAGQNPLAWLDFSRIAVTPPMLKRAPPKGITIAIPVMVKPSEKKEALDLSKAIGKLIEKLETVVQKLMEQVKKLKEQMDVLNTTIAQLEEKIKRLTELINAGQNGKLKAMLVKAQEELKRVTEQLKKLKEKYNLLLKRLERARAQLEKLRKIREEMEKAIATGNFAGAIRLGEAARRAYWAQKWATALAIARYIQYIVAPTTIPPIARRLERVSLIATAIPSAILYPIVRARRVVEEFVEKKVIAPVREKLGITFVPPSQRDITWGIGCARIHSVSSQSVMAGHLIPLFKMPRITLSDRLEELKEGKLSIKEFAFMVGTEAKRIESEMLRAGAAPSEIATAIANHWSSFSIRIADLYLDNKINDEKFNMWQATLVRNFAELGLTAQSLKTITDRTAEYVKLAKEADKYQAKLMWAETDKAYLLLELDEAKKRMTELESKLKTATGEERRRIEEDMKKVADEIKKLDVESKKIDEELKKTEAMLEDVQAKKLAIVAQVQQLQVLHLALITKILADAEEKREESEKRLESVKREFEKLEKQKDELNAEVQRLRMEEGIRAFIENQITIEAMRIKSDLTQPADLREMSISELKERIRPSIESKTDDLVNERRTAISRQLVDLERKIAPLHTEIERLKTEISTANAKITDTTIVQNFVLGREIPVEKNYWRTEGENLALATEMIHTLHRRVAELNTSRAIAVKALEAREKELESKSEEYKKYETTDPTKAAKIKGEIDRLSKEIKEYTTSISDIDEGLAKLRGERDRLLNKFGDATVVDLLSKGILSPEKEIKDAMLHLPIITWFAAEVGVEATEEEERARYDTLLKELRERTANLHKDPLSFYRPEEIVEKKIAMGLFERA